MISKQKQIEAILMSAECNIELANLLIAVQKHFAKLNELGSCKWTKEAEAISAELVNTVWRA